MDPSQPSTRRPTRSVRFARGSALVAIPLVAALLLGAPAASAQQPPPRPCVDDPLHGELDFWVGDWEALGGDGERLGTNRVRRLHGGCVIEETWRSDRNGVTGQSMSFIDPRDGRWRQIWVDSSGTTVRYEGELREGAMHFAGENVRADGKVLQARSVLEPLGEDRLHHRIEHSEDGGESWRVVFDVTYVPRGEGVEEMVAPAPEPDATPSEEGARPAEPTPETSAPRSPTDAPTPPDEKASEERSEPASEPSAPPTRPGAVRAASGAVPEDELPVEERNRIVLESPMILEVAIGPIESIPEAYSWSSDETSVYVVDGIRVRRVALSRDEGRGTVDVEAVVALHASGFLRHVDLSAELIWQGESLASASRDSIALGRSIKAQAEGRGLEKSLTLSLDRGRFEELFGGQEERPLLRLTVTVRD